MFAVEDFIDEVIDETVGTSKKKWAVVLMGFVAGVIAAIWVARRARSTRTEVPAAPVEV